MFEMMVVPMYATICICSFFIEKDDKNVVIQVRLYALDSLQIIQYAVITWMCFTHIYGIHLKNVFTTQQPQTNIRLEELYVITQCSCPI